MSGFRGGHPVTAALDIHGLAKAFGGVRALAGVDLRVGDQEILGLIGPNGSGKTTLVVSGFVRPDGGTVLLHDRPITGFVPHVIARAGVARTFQNLRIFRRRTVLENVLLGQTPRVSTLDILNPLPTAHHESQRRTALGLLGRFGLERHADVIAGGLSFGDQKRLELARALAGEPRLLLLDEPAGGMNPSEIEALTHTLRAARDEGIAILLIEHNMKLVMQLCDRIAVLASGELIATGTPDEIRHDARVIRSYLGEE
jgi:ABC-type branched-subunit amino acid transport system ATPase component